MDVLDEADGDFFHQHLPDDLRYAGLGVGFADNRTTRISDDPDHARYTILSGSVGQRLHPSGVARIHGSAVVDRIHYFDRLDHYRYALGVKMIEYFRLKIEDLRPASSGSILRE